jgi:peptidoglycan/xylan/chitin deacetylase (PgdA/CDA1 family)/PKD repeat protein
MKSEKMKKLVLGIAIITILLIATGCASDTFPREVGIADGSPSSNWLSGWSYRKSHLINSATGGGTNYQVQITVINGTGTDSVAIVYENNKARADFGDIRFTNSDAVTLLNYWTEKVNTGVNATFWVQVAEDLSSVNRFIYVYYGNPTATSVSNGNNTFSWFDDGSDASRWTAKVDGAVGGTISSDGNILTCTNLTGTPRWGQNATFPTTYALVTRVESASGNTYDQAALEVMNNTNGKMQVEDSIYPHANRQFYSYISGGVYHYPYTSPSPAIQSNVWYILQLRCGSAASTTADLLTDNWGAWDSPSSSHDVANTGAVEIGTNLGTDYYDWLFVRKYVASEPAQGAWGTEEPFPQNGTFPQNGAVSITFDEGYMQYDYAWPLLKARGMVATFYVVTGYITDLYPGVYPYMNTSQLKDLYNSGNEIASHSMTHPDFTSISDAQIVQECVGSKQLLESLGFVVTDFAYPYATCNAHTDSIVSQYYRSGRAGYSPPYIIQLPVNQFNLPAFFANDTAEIENMVDQVYATKGWAIMLFHNVSPNGPGLNTVSTDSFGKFLDYLILKGVKTLTVNQALDLGSPDVAITSVVPSTVQALAGTIININVTAKNNWTMTETFNVTTYYDNNKTETQTVTNLTTGATRIFTFNWNTATVTPGTYTIKAEASTVPNEINTANNLYVDGTVSIYKSPIASFTYYPSNPRINETVLFNASSSVPNGGTITNYKWNFDDGNTTSTPNPTTIQTYTIPRTYNVTLTVTNTEGLNASAWNLIAISAPVQTTISIFTHASSNFVGFKVEINGTLTDSGGKEISGANIVVSYTLPSVSEWVPFISATTDLQGTYYSQWIPPATGDFTLKAEWAGNQTNAGANQNTTLSIIPYNDKYVFSVASNSTISALAFNSTSQELSFTATGPSGTTGFTKVTIAKTLVADIANLIVYLDGQRLQYSVASTVDSWILSFAYTHSTHHIRLALLPGDINNDGKVSLQDLIILAKAYGSKPGDPNWNPKADLDGNGIVNIIDLTIMAREYGVHV